MDPQPAWRTASDRGARDADAVAAAHGVVALADGIGDDLTAAHAALQAATAAVSVPTAAGPAEALVQAAHMAGARDNATAVVLTAAARPIQLAA